jgi:methylthioribose-1-phosphate isomerase
LDPAGRGLAGGGWEAPVIDPGRDDPPAAPDAAGPTLADSVVLRDDGVHILDRRTFPFERRWVHCRTVEDVAGAISTMVTQSLGPTFAVLWGLVLAARSIAPDAARADQLAQLARIADRLAATRPTNDVPAAAASSVLATVPTGTAGDAGPFADDVMAAARAIADGYRRRCAALGRHTAALIPDDATVLTHCWADLYLIETVRALLRRGTRVRFVCTETRPYLQGARLTAETLAEMGLDVTVITDGMGAAVMGHGGVGALITGADRVTRDGHVVNKVGTLGLALAAATFGVPYHALTLEPDLDTPTAHDVPIEQRDGAGVLSTLGHRTASWKARGLYPAFDVTPPRYVTTVVTDRGPLSPDRLTDYGSRPAPVRPEPSP